MAWSLQMTQRDIVFMLVKIIYSKAQIIKQFKLWQQQHLPYACSVLQAMDYPMMELHALNALQLANINATMLEQIHAINQQLNALFLIEMVIVYKVALKDFTHLLIHRMLLYASHNQLLQSMTILEWMLLLILNQMDQRYTILFWEIKL